jgi:hypothetical protein
MEEKELYPYGLKKSVLKELVSEQEIPKRLYVSPPPITFFLSHLFFCCELAPLRTVAYARTGVSHFLQFTVIFEPGVILIFTISSARTIICHDLGCRSEISFGLFSPSEMQRLSEIQVVSHLLFQLPKREPMPYGPLDPRMVHYTHDTQSGTHDHTTHGARARPHTHAHTQLTFCVCVRVGRV